MPPNGTKALALIVDDRDAPGGHVVHWVLYDSPGRCDRAPAGAPADETVRARPTARTAFASSATAARARSGKVHHYVFKL